MMGGEASEETGTTMSSTRKVGGVSDVTRIMSAITADTVRGVGVLARGIGEIVIGTLIGEGTTGMMTESGTGAEIVEMRGENTLGDELYEQDVPAPLKL